MGKNQIKMTVFGLGLAVVAGVSFLALQGLQTADVGILINGNDRETQQRRVTLTLEAPDDVVKMKISNDVNFDDESWQPFQEKKTWTLPFGAGTKLVYAQFRFADGDTSEIADDRIRLDIPSQMNVGMEIDGGAESTDARYVLLEFDYSPGVESITISNYSDFRDGRTYTALNAIQWSLPGAAGEKTVYAKFFDANEQTKVVSETIAFEPKGRALAAGEIVTASDRSVYYVGADGRLHPFLSSATFWSWQQNMRDVQFVSKATLQTMQNGQPVCVRPGTWLVRLAGGSRVYVVESGCQIRPLRSAAEAMLLYGSNWEQRVIDLSNAVRSFYRVRSYSVADSEQGVVDNDADGVDAETEAHYNTSDSRADSDADGLSDMEEIFSWLSSPRKQDTDGDGLHDGDEVAQGYAPTGSSIVTSLPAGYRYPNGTVVRHSNGRLYYQADDETIYRIDANTLKRNNFPTQFIVESRFSDELIAGSAGSRSGEIDTMAVPTRMIDSAVLPL